MLISVFIAWNSIHWWLTTMRAGQTAVPLIHMHDDNGTEERRTTHTNLISIWDIELLRSCLWGRHSVAVKLALFDNHFYCVSHHKHSHDDQFKSIADRLSAAQSLLSLYFNVIVNCPMWVNSGRSHLIRSIWYYYLKNSTVVPYLLLRFVCGRVWPVQDFEPEP